MSKLELDGRRALRIARHKILPFTIISQGIPGAADQIYLTTKECQWLAARLLMAAEEGEDDS